MTAPEEPNAVPSEHGVCRARPKFPAAMGAAAFRRLPPPVTEMWDWQLRGACRGLDGGVFFHPDGERGPARAAREARAKQVCRICPVLDQCRRHALSVQEPYGIWGGLSESERDDLTGRSECALRTPPATRPEQSPPTPGLARNDRAGSGKAQHAEGDPLRAGVLELAAPVVAELRLIQGARVTAAAVAPTVLSVIHGSREEPQQFLTVVEVAAMLRVSRATVYRLVHAGHLPGMRVGRSVRVSRATVETYMRDAALGGPHT